ncbi:type II secretion system F family protein [Niveispirillum sp. KHB5.9]|uniref:type II secretion system F family protein n=1 Tax=Niveispirillum sp. KHB5.9 TaxID=3400269 RepID=UPI003A89298A
MPEFTYIALDNAGTERSGRMEGASDAAILERLRGQGWHPVRVAPVAARRLSSAGADTDDLLLATKELRLLLRAGLPLERALSLLAGGLAPAALRPRLTKALDRLHGGAGLGDALAKAGGFPPLYAAMVRAGEGAGALDLVLEQLCLLLDRQRRVARAVTSALIYPTVLGLVAVSSLLLLLLYVVPQFAPLFANARQALPASTELVLALSAFLGNWADMAFAGLLCLVLLGWLLLRRPSLGPWRDRMRLRLPLLGPMAVMAGVARMARGLSVLLRAGVGLPRALELSAGMAGNSVLATSVLAMRDAVRDGRPLTAGLPKDHPLPDLAVTLIRVGEQSARLAEVAEQLAEMYEDKLETAIKRFLALLEPALILLLALFVGGIVVSILMALVSINELAF